jgi:hypothetical protein
MRVIAYERGTGSEKGWGEGRAKGERARAGAVSYHPEDIGRAVLEDEKDEEVVELVEDEVACHEHRGIGIAFVFVALSVILIVLALFGRDSDEALESVEEILRELSDGDRRV